MIPWNRFLRSWIVYKFGLRIFIDIVSSSTFSPVTKNVYVYSVWKGKGLSDLTWRYRFLLSERKQTILIWYIKNCIVRKSLSFWPKNSGSKRSNLIWSGNCLRQSKTFLFNPKTNRSKQNILIWSIYYQNESKTFRFGPLIIGMEAKQLII